MSMYIPTKTARGSLILGHGFHEIRIDLNSTPQQVYFSMTLPSDDTIPPCGQPDTNKIGVNITDEGFVIYADIRTTVCSIDWECRF